MTSDNVLTTPDLDALMKIAEAGEPSEAAMEMATASYLKAVRWATGNKRAEPANEFALREALRAAYAVDAANTAQSRKPAIGATEGGVDEDMDYEERFAPNIYGPW